MTGKVVTINFQPSDTVRTIKEEYFRREGTPVDQQELVFGSQQLQDGRTMADCNITNESTIHLVLKLNGGA